MSLSMLVVLLPRSSVTGEPGGSTDAGWVEGARQEAAALRSHAADISTRHAGRSFGRVKAAVDALIAAKRAEADALDRLAGTATGGNADEMRAARTLREKARWTTRRASERLQAREAEQRNTTDDRLIERLMTTTPPPAKPAMDALIKAKAAAAKAWGAVAEAASAEASALEIHAAREKAIAAEGSARVASRAYELACEEAGLTEQARQLGSKELGQKVSELKELDRQLLAIEMQRNEVELKLAQHEHLKRALKEATQSILEAARKLAQEEKSTSPASPSSVR
ncbi:MAG: hypothetical protein HY815_28140 [Candidatus Riflebacteria bacterium]|nr:hypothetical protein [Candidatus Riflebacteria bacterium]